MISAQEYGKLKRIRKSVSQENVVLTLIKSLAMRQRIKGKDKILIDPSMRPQESELLTAVAAPSLYNNGKKIKMKNNT